MNKISFELLGGKVIMEVSEQGDGNVVITASPKQSDEMCITSITPQGSAQLTLSVQTKPRPRE